MFGKSNAFVSNFKWKIHLYGPDLEFLFGFFWWAGFGKMIKVMWSIFLWQQCHPVPVMRSERLRWPHSIAVAGLYCSVLPLIFLYAFWLAVCKVRKVMFRSEVHEALILKELKKSCAGVTDDLLEYSLSPFERTFWQFSELPGSWVYQRGVNFVHSAKTPKSFCGGQNLAKYVTYRIVVKKHYWISIL